MKAELTKGDVYVVVDTPKKAKKLKKVLDVFGEKIYKSTNKRLSNGIVSEKYPTIILISGDWSGYPSKSIIGRTKVTIKELRNILAKEHLKKIALLKPKPKELEIGKWYHLSWDEGWCLAPFKGKDVASYGFHSDEGWMYGVYWFSDYNINSLEKREATPQEVKSALIEEAKRRYNVGDIIKCFDKVESEVEGLDFVFNNNNLFLNGDKVDGSDWFNISAKVFDNGKWAEVIDKFAELKEAHRKGAVIQWRREIDGDPIWKDCNEKDSPMWCEFNDYRIKPSSPELKVGDWMFNPKTKKITQVKSGWVKIKDTELVEKLNSL